MASNPNERRERFKNWVIDLQNILDCHEHTSGLLNKYPFELEKFDNNVDKAVMGLLHCITTGMTKRIVSNATSAHEALLDLKRNYGQCSQEDTHREQT